MSFPILDFIISPLTSCLLALLITPFLRRVAIVSSAFIDRPDERKIHRDAVPRLGGIAIVLSFFFTSAMCYALFQPELKGSTETLAGLYAGAAIVALAGIWDDLRGLNVLKKFISQVAAVLAIIPFGFVIRDLNILYVGVVDVGLVLGTFLTIFWIVGIINTINFIDGVDGLAGGVAIIISSALFVISIAADQPCMAIACIVPIGAVLGFLRYNFYPATVFMGDCGAMFLGFLLAAISIKVLFQNTHITASSSIPVLIFGLPIVDTTWAILRRLCRQRSPFLGNSCHIHHRLLNLGLTQRKVVFILYFISLLSVASGLIMALLGNETLIVVLSISMLVVALVIVDVLNRLSPPREFP